MTDETQKKGQDTLPAEQKPEPTSDQKKSEGTSQKKAPRMYSQDEVNKLLSDQASEHGRTAKSLKAQLASADLTKTERDELKLRLDEILGIKDDPDGKAAYLTQWEKDLKQQDSGLKERESKVSQWEKQKQEAEKLSQVTGIAKEIGVDPKELQRKVDEMGVTALSGIKFVAETMAEGKAAEKDVPGFKPDSGIGAGGGGEPTVDQLDKMTPEEYAAYHERREKKPKK